MIKLDHLTLPVRDSGASRDWYVGHLGLAVEFEVPARRAWALRDDADFTIFFEESAAPPATPCTLYFQVESVDATYARLSAQGVPFAHPPQRVYWGYGAELVDPDGYVVRLWDPVTMPK